MEERRNIQSPSLNYTTADEGPLDTTSSSALAAAERAKKKQEEKEKEEREERLKGFLKAAEREAEEKGEDFTPEDVKDNIAIFEANELAQSLEETVASLANIESAKEEARVQTISKLEADFRLLPESGRVADYTVQLDSDLNVTWAPAQIPAATTVGYVLMVKANVDSEGVLTGTKSWEQQPLVWNAD